MGQKSVVTHHHLSAKFLSPSERQRLDRSLDVEKLQSLTNPDSDAEALRVSRQISARILTPDPEYASIPPVKGEYRVISKLGSGAFGDVLKVLHLETSEIFAMKMIRMSMSPRQAADDAEDEFEGEEGTDVRKQIVMSAETELKLLPRLRHDNIVRYVDAFLYPWVTVQTPPDPDVGDSLVPSLDPESDSETSAETKPTNPRPSPSHSTVRSEVTSPHETKKTEVHLCLIMEYVKGSDLDALLTFIETNQLTIPHRITIKWFLTLLKVLQYFHSLSIIHRDLKPDNILVYYTDIRDLSSMNLKITDFGVGKDLRFGKGKEMRGNIFFTATEALKEKEYDERCDVFSLGLIFWMVWVGVGVESFIEKIDELCKLVRDIPELNQDFCRMFGKEDIYDSVTYVELLLFLHESGEIESRLFGDVIQSHHAVGQILKLMVCPVDERQYAKDLLKNPIVITWEYVLGMRESDEDSSLEPDQIDFNALVTFLQQVDGAGTEEEAVVFGNCVECLSLKLAKSEQEETALLLQNFEQLELFNRVFLKALVIAEQTRKIQQKVWPQFFRFLLQLLQIDSGRYLRRISVYLRTYNMLPILKAALLQHHSQSSLRNELYLLTLILIRSNNTIRKFYRDSVLPLFLLHSANPNPIIFSLLESLIPLVQIERDLDKVFTVYRQDDVLFFRGENALLHFMRNERVLHTVFSRIFRRLETLWDEWSLAADDEVVPGIPALRSRSSSAFGGVDQSLPNRRGGVLMSRHGRKRAPRGMSFFSTPDVSAAEDTLKSFTAGPRKRLLTTGHATLEHEAEKKDALSVIHAEIQQNILLILFLVCREKEKKHDIPFRLGESETANQLAFLATEPSNVQIRGSGNEFVCVSGGDELASMISLQPICVFRDSLRSEEVEFVVGYFEVTVLNGGTNDALNLGIWIDQGERHFLLDCERGLIRYAPTPVYVLDEESGEYYEQEQTEAIVDYCKMLAVTDRHIGVGVTNLGRLFFVSDNKLVRPFLDLELGGGEPYLDEETGEMVEEETRIYAHAKVSANEGLHCRVNFGTSLQARPFFFNYRNNKERQRRTKHKAALSTSLKVLRSMDLRILDTFGEDWPTLEDSLVVRIVERIRRALATSDDVVTDPVLLSASHKDDSYEIIFQKTNLRYVATEEVGPDDEDIVYEMLEPSGPRQSPAVPPSSLSPSEEVRDASESESSSEVVRIRDQAIDGLNERNEELSKTVGDLHEVIALVQRELEELRAEVREQQLKHDQSLKILQSVQEENSRLREDQHRILESYREIVELNERLESRVKGLEGHLGGEVVTHRRSRRSIRKHTIPVLSEPVRAPTSLTDFYSFGAVSPFVHSQPAVVAEVPTANRAVPPKPSEPSFSLTPATAFLNSDEETESRVPPPLPPRRSRVSNPPSPPKPPSAGTKPSLARMIKKSLVVKKQQKYFFD